jgi:LysM repeat protein
MRPHRGRSKASAFVHPDDRLDLADRWDSKGCVVLDRYECPADLHGSPGIWHDGRRTDQRPEADSGIVGMYAARTTRGGIRFRGHDQSQAAATRRSHGVALIAAPIPVGRSASAHYQARRRARADIRRYQQHQERDGMVGAAQWGTGSTKRVWWMPGGMRQVAVAGLAALVLILGTFATSLAEQYRYEVQEGDTIESIAETFGVDPQAIRQASYLPTGDDLTPGQAIVIPSIGQSPDDAAQEAASREGTSPWAVTAHWVQSGETIESIAAAYGLTAEALISFNGITDIYNIQVGQRIVIPPSRDVAPGAQVFNPAVAVQGVPTYKQSRNLSCEFAAVHIATAAYGNAIPEDVYIANTPITKNPHKGYRGNIDGWWGNTDDYGIYAEALVPILNQWGFTGEVFYSEGATGQLTAHLDAGHPVVVWLGFWGDTRVRLTDDGTYSVASGTHVVTVWGYDEAGVYVSDPATATYRFFDWDTFIAMWTVLDGQSLAIYPAQ